MVARLGVTCNGFKVLLSLSLLLQNGWTAVMLAAENGHLEVVRLLISSGASVKAIGKVSVRIIND